MKTSLMLKKAAILLIIFYGLVSISYSEIRYVSKIGSSTPPYTSWQSAADSIQKCINICNNGDTIIVANGTYRETLWIDKSIMLLGSSMDSTIIDGTGLDARPVDGYTGITVNIKSNVRIENFKIIGKGIYPGTATNVISAYNYPAEIQYCSISNAFEGVTFAHRSAIAENLFIENVIHPIEFTCKGDSSYFYINNNLIIMDGEHEPALLDDLGGHALINNNIIVSLSHRESGINADYYIRSADISNNLISGFGFENIVLGDVRDSINVNNNILSYCNTMFSIALEVVDGSKTKIGNNIFSNNNVALDIINHDSNSDYNIFWENKIDLNEQARYGEYDLKLDPMFVKDTVHTTLAADFHLQAFSPAIDAGDPNILDKDGSRSDIGFYGGPLGESYKYLDLPPSIPADVKYIVLSDQKKISFSWTYNTEKDFSFYKVYRDSVQGFKPAPSNLLFTKDTSVFIDNYDGSKKLYYRITAVDKQNNESQPGSEIEVILTDVNEPAINILREYFLSQNYPNPFNGSTKVKYSIKSDGHIRLSFYDMKGELVKIIIDKNQAAGQYEAVIGMKEMESLSSGIYLYKIEFTDENHIPRFTDIKKMVYLK